MVSLLADSGLDVQQISDNVLSSLDVCVRVVAELFTPVCVVVCTTVTFPVDGAEVLIYVTSSVKVLSVVLLLNPVCNVAVVTSSSGVVIVVLLI